MSDISKSHLERFMTPEMEAAVNACTSAEEITALLHAAEVEVGLRTPDPFNPSVLHEVAIEQPKAYTKTVEVGGQQHVIEAETAEGLAAAEVEFFRSVFGKQTQDPPQPEQKLELIFDPLAKAYRDSSGRFVSDQVARNIIEKHEQDANAAYRESALEKDLQMKLLRGEITLAQAMDQSGVVERAIDRRETQSWAEATAVALEGPMADWPGSPDGKLLERLGNKIEELGLEGASDKVSALTTAWQALQQEDAEQADAEAQSAYEKELAACNSRAEVDAVTAKYFAGRTKHGMSPDDLANGNFWNRS